MKLRYILMASTLLMAIASPAKAQNISTNDALFLMVVNSISAQDNVILPDFLSPQLVISLGHLICPSIRVDGNLNTVNRVMAALGIVNPTANTIQASAISVYCPEYLPPADNSND